MSDNPYRPADGGEQVDQSPGPSIPVFLIASAMLGLVIVNYSTASRTPIVSPTSFGDVVFCMLPVSSLAILACFSRPTANRFVFGGFSFVAIVVSLAFCVAFLPIFLLSDDYIGFVAERYFFGPWGIFPLIWFACCGQLPGVLAVLAATGRMFAVRPLACLVLVAHLQNAWFIWSLSHA